MRATGASIALLLAAHSARAAEPIDRRAIQTARDEVFARPEFAAAAEPEPSLIYEIGKWIAETVSRFQEENEVLYLVIVAVLVLTLIVLVAHIAWTLAVARRATYEDDPELPELDVRRTPPATFRSRAVELAAKGRYEDAARELYTALILALDARGDVSYARHKALLDYRLEARRDDAREAFELFAGGYHPASFGRRPLAQERFEILLAAVDRVSP